jgi:hypothetical protein
MVLKNSYLQKNIDGYETLFRKFPKGKNDIKLIIPASDHWVARGFASTLKLR